MEFDDFNLIFLGLSRIPWTKRHYRSSWCSWVTGRKRRYRFPGITRISWNAGNPW